MNNKKIAAGILLMGLGIAVSIFISSKKENSTGKNFLKKTKRLTSDLKGKFGDFVDQLSDKMKAVLK